jgi:CheY-like chemotaxis protein
MKTGVKILIVDDDLDFMEISKLSLERQGYKIQSAPNAKEGWKMVEKEKPDLILMDQMMEHLDAGMAQPEDQKSPPIFFHPHSYAHLNYPRHRLRLYPSSGGRS